jgi:hypothetical protein
MLRPLFRARTPPRHSEEPRQRGAKRNLLFAFLKNARIEKQILRQETGPRMTNRRVMQMLAL